MEFYCVSPTSKAPPIPDDDDKMREAEQRREGRCELRRVRVVESVDNEKMWKAMEKLDFCWKTWIFFGESA